MDSLLKFILYFLFSFGCTAIFQYSEIAQPIRNLIIWKPLKKMTECSMCLGFWIGFINALLFFSQTLQFSYERFALAVASSGVTWLLMSVTQYALWAKCYYQTQSNYKCEDKNS